MINRDKPASELFVHIPVVELIDRETRHLGQKMDLQFVAHQQALEIALSRLDERLAEMNQFREQISTERVEFLTRSEYDREHKNVTNDVGALKLQASRLSGSIWMLGAAISAVVVGINLIMKYVAK